MILKIDTERKLVVVSTSSLKNLEELIKELTVLGLQHYQVLSEEQYGQLYR